MQEKKYSIKKWAKDDRPREKLLSKSPSALSDSELLAILIQNGNQKKNALEVAREVLQEGRNNLQELGKLSVKRLMKINGIGAAKAIMIAAVMELGRRQQAAMAMKSPTVKGSHDIANYLQALIKDYHYEVFVVVFLNHANRVKHFEVISIGGISSTIADPRIIFKRALEEEAASLILCHNHPSGSLKPSKADEVVTRKLQEAGKIMDINILDHIIVSDAGYFSFADEGLL